ncbi:MAG: DUF2357 domain-containing protein [Bacilli bacterium]|nr:DUF2357 domain-containing protein [Bacilli bacterium]
MDNKEIDEISFLNNINSTLAVKKDYQNMQYDYEWLDKIENCMPYIDNILRNPKRFIVNEEEIVKVELAKKTTVESIIHLTQHTNFIQDYNQKTGDVKPSKVLNINKDESFDTYENKFIFTLINNIRLFYTTRCSETGLNSFFQDKKDLDYTANTKLGTEKVKMKVIFSSIDKDTKEVTNSQGMSIGDRLKKIKNQLDAFTQTELYKTLNRLHVSPVRSPIRKTNVILKNPNFQQAEQLWNYIQTFESKDKKDVNKLDYLDQSELRDQYDQIFMMIYTANGMLGREKSNKESYGKVINDMIDRFIENMLESAAPIEEDELKVRISKEMDKIKNKNDEKRESIYNIFRDRLEREENKIVDMVNLLEGEI